MKFHKDGTLPHDPDTILVFGSNARGLHTAGAAQVAVERFGARDGVPAGPQGNAYAIVTANIYGMPTQLTTLQERVELFLDHAVLNIKTPFFVTRIGCGIVGYRDDQVAPMFKLAPPNVSLPEEWKEYVI